MDGKLEFWFSQNNLYVTLILLPGVSYMPRGISWSFGILEEIDAVRQKLLSGEGYEARGPVAKCQSVNILGYISDENVLHFLHKPGNVFSK